MRVILRGRCSIWSRWRMSPVALRIVNDVSYVTRANHVSDFAWQAQHLVTLVTLVLRALQMRTL